MVVRKIRVLVVDDSILFREILIDQLKLDPYIEVAGYAVDSFDAFEKIESLRPDVITLDVEMPKMNGIEFLKKLMPVDPHPVVVVSSLPINALDALEVGAVDFVKKPVIKKPGDLQDFIKELASMIKIASIARIGNRKPREVVSIDPSSEDSLTPAHVVIPVLSGTEIVTPIGGEPATSPKETDANSDATGGDGSKHPMRETQGETPVAPPVVPSDEPLKGTVTVRDATASQSEQTQSQMRHERLVEKLKKVIDRTQSSIGKTQQTDRKKDTPLGKPPHKKQLSLVAVGASTGGTEAVLSVIRELPENFPSVLVVQHMPAGFTKMYAERLHKNCKMTVKECQDGDRVEPGLVLIAAGEHHMWVEKDSRGLYVRCQKGEKVSGHCPSVDVLFNSVADIAGEGAVGVILTGMGSDGAKGLLNMRNQGAYTIGQDKDTSVVYGMPMASYNIGAVAKQLPLDRIAPELIRYNESKLSSNP